MSSPRSFAATIIFLYAIVAFSDDYLGRVSSITRVEYLHRARVWRKVDIPNQNILAGPQSPIAVPLDHEVPCHYVEPDGSPGGFSPKFQCKLDSGEVVRVKYQSREVFGEIAGSRLLWALGFYADENYPVKIVCLDCPQKNPTDPSDEDVRGKLAIENAMIERSFPGDEIEVQKDQGWEWNELDHVDEKAGGAPRAQIDALKLIAVFMQHNDSKQQQQRLACLPQDIGSEGDKIICKQPVLMIQDLGSTFGMGGEEVTAASSMYFRGWKNQTVWNYAKEEEYAKENPEKQSCVANLVSAEFAKRDGLTNPLISEAGRQFLADLLNQLTDKQISDLFRVARSDKLGEMIYVQGRKIPVTIEDWVSAFKEKRQEINNHRCL